MVKKSKQVVTILVTLSIVVLGAVSMVHTIDAESCTSCGLCEETCPEGAISAGEVDGMETYVIDPELCTNCGECASSCPVEAIIEVERSSVVEEVTETATIEE